MSSHCLRRPPAARCVWEGALEGCPAPPDDNLRSGFNAISSALACSLLHPTPVVRSSEWRARRRRRAWGSVSSVRVSLCGQSLRCVSTRVDSRYVPGEASERGGEVVRTLVAHFSRCTILLRRCQQCVHRTAHSRCPHLPRRRGFGGRGNCTTACTPSYGNIPFSQPVAFCVRRSGVCGTNEPSASAESGGKLA